MFLPLWPERRASRAARLVSAGLLWAWVSLAPRLAPAQVNAEVLRKVLGESGASAKIDVSVATYRGNTRGSNLGASASVGVSGSPHLGYAHVSGRYAHLGGDVQIANYFAHVRYNYELTPALWAELLAQTESDRFRRLEVRQLLGSGLRFAVFDRPALSLHYGVTYLLEYNRLASGYDPVRPDVVHRLGTYLSAVVELEEARAMASTTLYYQPRLDRVEDYRLLSVSSLEFRIAGTLTSGIHATVRGEYPVPEGVKGIDLTVTNTLGLSL